jgi:hypothetical protein
MPSRYSSFEPGSLCLLAPTEAQRTMAKPAQSESGGGGGGGESFLRVHWVAVPEAMRARRPNRRSRAAQPA